MSQILSYFIRLCLLRARPRDAPASDYLLVVSALLVAISYALTNTMYDDLLLRSFVSVAQILVFGGVVWVVLKIRGLEARWRQTVTALYGAAALFQFATWPFIVADDSVGESATGLPEPLWLHLLVGVWYLVVMSHVFRHALDTSIMRGFAASLFCQLTTVFGLVLILAVLGVGGPA